MTSILLGTIFFHPHFNPATSWRSATMVTVTDHLGPGSEGKWGTSTTRAHRSAWQQPGAIRRRSRAHAIQAAASAPHARVKGRTVVSHVISSFGLRD